jgi:hypothetical protein
MHRFLIALAIVVGVCAVGAVGFVVYKSNSGHQAVVAPTEETTVASQPAKSTARAVRPRGTRPAPVIAAASPDNTAVPADSATAAVTGSLDVEALVKSLTPEEEKALDAVLLTRAMQQRMQDRRYQSLPINGKFRALDRLGDPKLKLTDAQRAQFDSVMQNMKPQMDTAFKDVWAQQDQLRGQIGQIFTSTTDRDQARQQVQAIQQQISALNASVQPQQDALDQQVMAAMTPYLTQDQVQALNTMPAQTGGGGFFGPGGGGPPGGGNPGGPGGGGGRRGGRGGGGGNAGGGGSTN